MPLLDNTTVEVIIEDITKEIEFCKGKIPQVEVWLDLQEKAEEERKRRQEEGKWL